MALFRRAAAASLARLVDDPAQDDGELVEVRDAVRSGADWQPAAALLDSTAGDPDRRGAVADALSEAAAQPAPWLDRWLVERPDDPGAHLVSAWATVQRAWDARGGGWAKDVDEDAFAAFFRLLDDALPLCHHAARSGGDDPTPWVIMLWLAVGRQEERDAFDDRWSELVRRDPHNRLGHNAALQYLSEKWYGSHEDMYAFARSASEAPWGAVVPLQAHAEYVLRQASKGTRAAYAVVDHWKRPEVAADLDTALAWARSGPQQHAYALHDLTVVGYGLAQAERWADASEVFALTGDRAYHYPWYYEGDAAKAFATAHRKAAKHGA